MDQPASHMENHEAADPKDEEQKRDGKKWSESHKSPLVDNFKLRKPSLAQHFARISEAARADRFRHKPTVRFLL